MQTMFQNPTRPVLRAISAATAVGIVTALLAPLAAAQEQGEPQIVRLPAWYDGMKVTQLRRAFDADAGLYPAVAVTENKPEQVPGTFNSMIGITDAAQYPVIDSIPGDPDYTGWWKLRIIYVAIPMGPVTSMAEIEAQLCQVQSPAFPGNIVACIQNGTPLIDIAGFAGDLPVIKIPIMNAPNPPGCDR